MPQVPNDGTLISCIATQIDYISMFALSRNLLVSCQSIRQLQVQLSLSSAGKIIQFWSHFPVSPSSS